MIQAFNGHGKKDLSQSQIPQISPASLADLLNQIAQISPKYERDLRTNHFFRSPN
jgi:hypothetical protein